MNEDHGSEQNRGGGCSGGYDQPDDPAARHEPTTLKSPPIPAVGPGYAGPVAARSEQAALGALPADGSTQSSHVVAPTPVPSAATNPGGHPESFANIVGIVERSAMPETDRREVYLDILRRMSPTLHGIASTSQWDSSRIARMLTGSSDSRNLPPRVGLFWARRRRRASSRTSSG